MRDLSNLLWSDLKDDDERIYFLQSDRAYDTGIIAPVMVDEIVNLLKCRKALQIIASGKPEWDNATPEMEVDGMRLIAEIALDV